MMPARSSLCTTSRQSAWGLRKATIPAPVAACAALAPHSLCARRPLRSGRPVPVLVPRSWQRRPPAETRSTPAARSIRSCSTFRTRSGRRPAAGSCHAKHNRRNGRHWSSRIRPARFRPGGLCGRTRMPQPSGPSIHLWPSAASASIWHASTSSGKAPIPWIASTKKKQPRRRQISPMAFRSTRNPLR